MPTSDPLVLTHATRLPYSHARGHSRSPSRSPLRKSQFTARELDPLLGNLSPDSTLQALRTTETITPEDGKQDALATSIAEASPAEREIGIRAAVAAQKLKQWHHEVSRWPWPARRDRSWGAGFLTPKKSRDEIPTNDDVSYLGSLPALRVTEYEDRIEDIRDGIEALDLEEVKEHIFSAHIPTRPTSSLPAEEQSSEAKHIGYGRMRDFTALITATVIQALPELANLTVLLDTWNIRLSVLRQIPSVMQSFQTTQAGVQTAFAVVRSPDTGSLVTLAEYETTKHILGEKIVGLGAKIDKLLDLLEGQDDTLPKAWIDHVENIENGYAAWVVEAEHVAIRNDLLSRALADQTKQAEKAKQEQEKEEQAELGGGQEAGVVSDSHSISEGDIKEPSLEFEQELRAAEEGFGDGDEQLSHIKPADLGRGFTEGPPRTQQLLPELDAVSEPSIVAPVPISGHTRGVSKASVADSTFSAVSGLSTAEIADARSTPVLASPKISMIDNPFRASRDGLGWFAGPKAEDASIARPPMVQRASTTSVEAVPRDSIKHVNLIRSRSQDMLAHSSPTTPRPGTPSQALQQLTGVDVDGTAPIKYPQLESTVPGPEGDAIPYHVSPPTATPPTPINILVPRALMRDDEDEESSDESESPELPRRSSKRVSQNLHVRKDLPIPLTPIRTSDQEDLQPDNPITPVHMTTPHTDETLEAKIKDILDTMPTKIRLARDLDGDSTHQSSSTSSTRSSTPVPSLTLSPVKGDRISRKATPGDVRVFHLTKSGQSRDVPPVKLFVRAVGEHGERVMVRVGGGWADLAEYLREYSLHHGHRGLAHGNLEVANFPTVSGARRDVAAPHTAVTAAGHPRTDVLSSHFDGEGELPLDEVALKPDGPRPLIISKTRKGGVVTPADGTKIVADDSWTPPPVPPIPSTYTVQFPTTVTTTSHGYTSTSTIDPNDFSITTYPVTSAGPTTFANAVPAHHTTGTHISAPSNGNVTYTPLGAAGPISNGRRVASHNASSDVARESWVDGMVGKARAVSSGTTVIHGPTISTTTTVVSRSTPTRRPASTLVTPSPVGNVTSSPGTGSPVSAVSKTSPSPSQSRSRKSVGDVSGIRRVFLRRKSDK